MICIHFWQLCQFGYIFHLFCFVWFLFISFTPHLCFVLFLNTKINAINTIVFCAYSYPIPTLPLTCHRLTVCGLEEGSCAVNQILTFDPWLLFLIEFFVWQQTAKKIDILPYDACFNNLSGVSTLYLPNRLTCIFSSQFKCIHNHLGDGNRHSYHLVGANIHM